jgi:hypothetical protein
MSLLRKPRRRSRLHRRYGCFVLPRVSGARVMESKRKNVSWLARTDHKAKTIEFSEHFDRLSPEAKRFIVLHERAHLETGSDHNEQFVTALKKLIKANHVSWEIAFELEMYNCHSSH